MQVIEIIKTFFAEYSTTILIVALSAAALDYIWDWNKQRIARNLYAAKLANPQSAIAPAPKEIIKQTKKGLIKRLVKIHGISEFKAKKIQKVIYKELDGAVKKAKSIVNKL